MNLWITELNLLIYHLDIIDDALWLTTYWNFGTNEVNQRRLRFSNVLDDFFVDPRFNASFHYHLSIPIKRNEVQAKIKTPLKKTHAYIIHQTPFHRVSKKRCLVCRNFLDQTLDILSLLFGVLRFLFFLGIISVIYYITIIRLVTAIRNFKNPIKWTSYLKVQVSASLEQQCHLRQRWKQLWFPIFFVC